MVRRNRRTDLDMKHSGQWALIGRKHWKHESGVEIRYDCNRWGWEISTRPGQYWKTLDIARYEVEEAM